MQRQKSRANSADYRSRAVLDKGEPRFGSEFIALEKSGVMQTGLLLDRVSHHDWHPKEDLIAVINANSIFLYEQDSYRVQ